MGKHDKIAKSEEILKHEKTTEFLAKVPFIAYIKGHKYLQDTHHTSLREHTHQLTGYTKKRWKIRFLGYFLSQKGL